MEAWKFTRGSFVSMLHRFGSFLLALALEEEDEVDGDEDANGNSGEDGDNPDGSNKKGKASKPVKEKVVKLWLDRDLKVAAAIAEQRDWLKETRSVLESCHSNMCKTVGDIEESGVKENLQNELRFSQARQQACAMVLGLPDWQKPHDKQPDLVEAFVKKSPSLAAGQISLLCSNVIP